MGSAISVRKRRSEKPISIRALLMVVAGATAVCALVIGILAGWYSWHQQKLRLGQNLVATSRALIQSSDRELEQSAAILRALSRSAYLRKDDLVAFEHQTRELLQPYGYFLIVSEPDSSREWINTSLPHGSPLPDMPPDWISSASRQEIAEVKSTTRDSVGWAVAVQMLASSEAGQTYVLTLGVPARRFQRMIDNQRLPPEWSPVILDQDWTIVARGVSSEKFVGQKGANIQLKDVPASDSLYEARVLEGYATIHARSRSDQFGWTAAVAVPQTVVTIEFLGPAIVTGLAGFIISLLAAALIGIFAARLGRDVEVLSMAAASFAEGNDHSMPQLRVRELADVAEQIQYAAKRLETEEKFRKRVVDELSHRLRNKIATIQAILGYQLRQHPQLFQEICERLHALAATDELIIAAQGKGAELRRIIDAELAPYDRSRVFCNGPEIHFEPKLALALALLLHELATNASKHGSLSSATGRVAIRWSIANDQLRLEWRESGGPTVIEPSRRGFGTRLINGVLASFGGEVDALFEPAGLVCTITMDMTELVEGGLPEHAIGSIASPSADPGPDAA